MKHKLIRAICIALAVIMASSVFVGAVASAAEGVQPVIFVLGIWENALYSDPQTDEEYRLFPPTQGEALEVGTHFMVDIILGSQGDEFSKASTEAMNTVSNMLTPILCQPTGISKALNIGPRHFDKSLDNYTPSQLGGALTKVAENIGSKVGAEHCYVFNYDFRLYPQSHAKDLDAFIKHVKADSGASKVRIFAAGFGGIVANCYLYQYGAEAAKDVSAVEFFTSLVGGTRLMGDIMKGNLAYTIEDMTDANEVETSLEAFANMYGNARGSAFIRWINDLPTTVRSDIQNYFKAEVDAQYSTIFKMGATFTIWLTNYIVNKDQIWTDAGLNYDIYIRWAQTNMYDAYLKDLLKYTPGFWAMVPTVDYKEALDYMFADEVIDETLENYLKDYYLIQNRTRNTLGDAKANGINITLLAGYNLQLLPVTAHMGGQSDGLVDTTYATLGSTDPQLNDYWLRSTAQCQDKTHDHTSRDDWEDASTCMFPENTWFIKNLPHNGVEAKSLANVALFLLDGSGQRSVWDHALYPQFMYYSGVTSEVGPYSAKAIPDKYLPGDIDLDGDVDADDARTALRVAIELENVGEAGFINADIDNDGSITAQDARAILAAAIGLIKLSADEETGEIVTEPVA